LIRPGRKSAAQLSMPPLNGGPPRLDPPEFLSEPERKLFLELTEACSPGHFVRSDLPLLTAFVQATELSRSAIRRAGDDPAALGPVGPCDKNDRNVGHPVAVKPAISKRASKCRAPSAICFAATMATRRGGRQMMEMNRGDRNLRNTCSPRGDRCRCHRSHTSLLWCSLGFFHFPDNPIIGFCPFADLGHPLRTRHSDTSSPF